MGVAMFYHLTQRPLEATLPMLLDRALAAGWRVVVRGTDPARLDWLEEEGCEALLVDATQDPQDGQVWVLDGYPVAGETLRAAIDAAMKESGDG